MEIESDAEVCFHVSGVGIDGSEVVAARTLKLVLARVRQSEIEPNGGVAVRFGYCKKLFDCRSIESVFDQFQA